MIRPTRRAVLLFAALLPLPWALVVANAALWPFAFEGTLLVLIVAATDAALAYPRGSLRAELALPHAAFVGEPVRAALTLALGGRRPPARFEVAVDASGDAQPSLARERFFVNGRAEGPITAEL